MPSFTKAGRALNSLQLGYSSMVDNKNPRECDQTKLDKKQPASLPSTISAATLLPLAPASPLKPAALFSMKTCPRSPRKQIHWLPPVIRSAVWPLSLSPFFYPNVDQQQPNRALQPGWWRQPKSVHAVRPVVCVLLKCCAVCTICKVHKAAKGTVG